MKTETFDDPKAFMEALHGKHSQNAPRKRQEARGGAQAQNAPRAKGERTGLTTLLLDGWCNEYDKDMNMRLYKGAATTAYYADEKAACDAAKALAACGRVVEVAL